MWLEIVAVIGGLVALVWSADKFVEGSALTARHFGLSPLLIGMVIVGFGTSAPEMVVSTIAAWQGNPALAIGNAYGSNITNIALILGLTAVMHPIAVHSRVLRKELPILLGVSLISLALVWNLEISRLDALILLGVFGVLFTWTISLERKDKADALGLEMEQELQEHTMPLKKSIMWLIVGLVLLILSSRLLVWGAVGIAQMLGVSDLIIGLTVLAIGTSLPELASSVIASRKGEHDIALGNVLGSNLFNTLTVVGIAGVIKPLALEPAIINRDMSVMVALTLSLFLFGYGFKSEGRINRIEGAVLLFTYVGYTAYLVSISV